MSPLDAAPCVCPIATPPEKLKSAFRFQAERSGVAVCEPGESIRIEYMKRLITPRSQRRIIGTVLPSIVVVMLDRRCGRRRGRVVGQERARQVAVDERRHRRRFARRRLRDRRQAHPGRVARSRTDEDLLVRSGEHRALKRVVRQLQLVVVLVALRVLVAARDDRALAERQAGDDALELVVPLRVGPEGGGDVIAVERHVDVAERRLLRDGDLDPRVVAGDVLRRARDDADRQRVLLGGRLVAGGGRRRYGDERCGDDGESPGRSFHVSPLPLRWLPGLSRRRGTGVKLVPARRANFQGSHFPLNCT